MRSYRTLYNTIRDKAGTGVALTALFVLAVPGLALDSELFLRTLPSTTLYDASSVSAREEESEENTPHDEVMPGTSEEQRRNAAFLKLWPRIGLFGFQPDIRSKDESIITSDDMSSIRVAKVSDMSATLAWSSPKLTKVTVFYSPVSPVQVSDKTLSASPWKVWNSKQVTLRGLTPSTTYHYKVVAVTALGTTTSAEASFKTVAR